MKRLCCLTVSFLFATCAFASAQQLTYPPTRTVDAADTYFGKTYKDPYRWLEDLKDKEVEGWFKAQAELADRTLAAIPGRDALAAEWMALDKLRPVAYGGIVAEGGRVFYKKVLGGENIGKLYFRDGWDGAERLLFDPATYPKEKTVVQSFNPSWDGKHVVLALTAGGAEYSELRVLAVGDGAGAGSGKLLPESIYPSMGVAGWAADNATFFYDAGKVTDIKSQEIELNRKTRLHKLGSPVADDLDFFSNESCPDLGITPREFPQASIDESFPNYVVGWVVTVQAETRLYCAPVAEMRDGGKPHWREVCKLSDNLVRGIAMDGDWVYGITHTDAPRYKVVRTRLDHPDWSHAETVIPEAADSVQSIVKSRHYLLVVYSNGVVGRVVKYNLATGKAAEVKLPAKGTVDVAVPDWKTDLCHVVVTSWTRPTTRYDFDANTDAFAKSKFSTDVVYPPFEDIVADEVEVPSHDGVMVPLSIIHRKDLPLDGSHPCILEGYGAYGMSMTPWFDIRNSVAARGVVIAIAHVRGGGEKGEAWYKAGYKTTKPNTWRDFIACGEYLVKKGYTSPARLAGTGTSAGGILISRAITERPDLFRAAVCNVGCANALRMEFTPNGPVNAPEFGTVKDESECAALAEMDGVAHVRPGVTYPAVLGVAGWNDPRVSPWQPGKFLAALQNATPADPARPLLMKTNYDNGHFTEEKLVTFQNFASQYAFLLWQTGHKDFQPGK
jgi:prolyl oligopeptidase